MQLCVSWLSKPNNYVLVPSSFLQRANVGFCKVKGSSSVLQQKISREGWGGMPLLPRHPKSVSDVMQTKTYSIFEEDGEPILHKAEGTEIQWKAGKNPTVKVRGTTLTSAPSPRLHECPPAGLHDSICF